MRTCGVTSGLPTSKECILCRPELADAQFKRTRIWEDEQWRLSAVLQGPIAGFAHLEPRRHIPFITDILQGARQEFMQIHVSGTVQEPKVSGSMMNTFTTTVDEVFGGNGNKKGGK